MKVLFSDGVCPSNVVKIGTVVKIDHTLAFSSVMFALMCLGGKSRSFDGAGTLEEIT